MLKIKDFLGQKFQLETERSIMESKIEKHIRYTWGKHYNNICLIQKNDIEIYGFATTPDGVLIEISIKVFSKAKKEIK